METGIDRKQVEAIKRFLVRVGSDAGRLRTAVCLVVAGLGLFAVEQPLGARLEEARKANARARSASHMAEEAVLFTKQRALYEDRVAVETDITDWQNYVLDLLRSTSAMLVSIEPRKPTPKGPFQVVEMELVAKGSSYNEFADFIERLEHGPRIVRLEKLRMERQQGTIYVTIIVKGLVKPSARKSKPAATTAAPGIDTPDDASNDAGGVAASVATDDSTTGSTDAATDDASQGDVEEGPEHEGDPEGTVPGDVATLPETDGAITVGPGEDDDG